VLTAMSILSNKTRDMERITGSLAPHGEGDVNRRLPERFQLRETSAEGCLPHGDGKTMVRRFVRSAGTRQGVHHFPETCREFDTMFRGSFTALVTPFDRGGRFDEKAFRAFVEWQIGEGTNGLVPVGTTGESPTLSHDEHRQVVKTCVEVAGGRVPVIAGAGSNNTEEAIELVEHAEKVGADAVLVVTPYYNKPTQRGLYAHYAAVAKATSLPIVIYNIPPRSVIDMTPETMGRLAHDFKNIVGVKDATGKVERVSEQRITCGRDFIQLSGEDASALGYNAHGGVGCISVTSNVAPRLCSEFQQATLNGDRDRAIELQDRLMPLHKALFVEPGVSGTKYALSRLGKVENVLRSPLMTVEESTAGQIDAALAHAGLMN
jgi:4-hydroxy-tetrahydrodipicolinate synthase